MQARYFKTLARALRGQLGRAGRNETGAVAVEYALLAVGIGIAIVVGIDAVGSALNTIFETDLAPLF